METIPTNIKNIRAGDLVFHDGRVQTVCGNNIKHDAGMGITLFGDSYRLGTLPVMKVKLV